MNCQMSVMPAGMPAKDDEPNCIIVGNAVTGLCTGKMNMPCSMPVQGMVTIANVDGTFLTIPGTLSTTNIIRQIGARMMWQDVVNRAIRLLALGPFGSHFFSARATVG
ncbi:hypothetical protein KIN20_032928 [Parelaphostrongylus tenuis]|uniref:Uncharacterized protein n=1 Tax=Parelaphostrongylus tenuis TaxID=148309 RepID=A0AAD5R7Q3_PARTN|nr:hypothetical protein KIN20_032928 [Parelaphostrongylus tenuis]